MQGPPWAVGLPGAGHALTAQQLREGVEDFARDFHPVVLHQFHGDWGAFFDSVDMFYPIAQWPRYYRQMAYGRPLTNVERFALFLFYAGNGLRPDIAALYVLVPHRRYDADAMRQMAWLVREAYAGRLFPRYSTWSMEHYVQLGPPPLQRN